MGRILMAYALDKSMVSHVNPDSLRERGNINVSPSKVLFSEQRSNDLAIPGGAEPRSSEMDSVTRRLVEARRDRNIQAGEPVSLASWVQGPRQALLAAAMLSVFLKRDLHRPNKTLNLPRAVTSPLSGAKAQLAHHSLGVVLNIAAGDHMPPFRARRRSSLL